MNEKEVAEGSDPEVGECHVCGRTFRTQEELSKHLMNEHEKDLLPGEPNKQDA